MSSQGTPLGVIWGIFLDKTCKGSSGAVTVLLRSALREPLIHIADDSQDGHCDGIESAAFFTRTEEGLAVKSQLLKHRFHICSSIW